MELKIGEKIKELRRQNDIIQNALAAHLNVSAQTVSKWENKVSMPDISLIPEIAAYFGVTIDELFGYTPGESVEMQAEKYYHVLAHLITAAHVTRQHGLRALGLYAEAHADSMNPLMAEGFNLFADGVSAESMAPYLQNASKRLYSFADENYADCIIQGIERIARGEHPMWIKDVILSYLTPEVAAAVGARFDSEFGAAKKEYEAALAAKLQERDTVGVEPQAEKYYHVLAHLVTAAYTARTHGLLALESYVEAHADSMNPLMIEGFNALVDGVSAEIIVPYLKNASKHLYAFADENYADCIIKGIECIAKGEHPAWIKRVLMSYMAPDVAAAVDARFDGEYAAIRKEYEATLAARLKNAGMDPAARAPWIHELRTSMLDSLKILEERGYTEEQLEEMRVSMRAEFKAHTGEDLFF